MDGAALFSSGLEESTLSGAMARLDQGNDNREPEETFYLHTKILTSWELRVKCF
jgi:hypothetical protein